MAKEFKITSLRLADLEKELNYLKTTREREVAAMIAEARSYGDLSENSEYDAAKNEQAKLYGRIAEISSLICSPTAKATTSPSARINPPFNPRNFLSLNAFSETQASACFSIFPGSQFISFHLYNIARQSSILSSVIFS